MAYTTINKSTDYFNTVLYTGNNSSPRTITGVGFQPDMNWSKIRSESADHWLQDAVRGANKIIRPNGTDDELVNGSGGYLSSFNADGYVIASGSSNNNNFNKSSGTYVSWNWKANGAGSANTDGSINSTVSVNTTAGFSIVSFTGTGSNATVGHGLGVVPQMVIIKDRTSGNDWFIYNKNVGATKYLKLNDNSAEASSSTLFQDTDPTNQVFSIGTNGNVNTNGNTYIAYCFAEKVGYSKFGSYVGNGNADGTFVYTGFKPSWLMIKGTGSTDNWHIFDIKRNPYYPTSSSYGGMATRLMANRNDADDLSQGGFEFLSNGLKMTTSWAGGNNSGEKFIYMAFGQSLVGSNNIPCTAR